jgi:hypothetical protein
MAVLSLQINDAPAAIALLDVRKRQRCYLRSPEPAPEKNREDGAVTLAPHGVDVGRVKQALRLAH